MGGTRGQGIGLVASAGTGELSIQIARCAVLSNKSGWLPPLQNNQHSIRCFQYVFFKTYSSDNEARRLESAFFVWKESLEMHRDATDCSLPEDLGLHDLE